MLILNAATLLFFSAGTIAIPPPLLIVNGPKVSMPFVGKLNTSGHTIAEMDRVRVAHFLSIAKTRKNETQLQVSVPITNQVVAYTATVGVGNPPTPYTLLIDIGSSNTWIGSGRPYAKTITSQNLGSSFSVAYSLGTVLGTEFADTVTLSDELVIFGQRIGVASEVIGFEAVDGILGLGPTDLTEGTVNGLFNVPTVTDNLFAQGTINQKVLGINFAPTSSLIALNGQLTFGGVDISQITGNLVLTPITSTSPASEFFGIDQSITYGASGQTILSRTAGIVDTGTALLLLATDAFNTYRETIGAQVDQATGLLTISAANYAFLQSLFFHIGDSTFEFTRNAQTWPRALNTAIGGSASQIYLVVADIGLESGQGFSFINGAVFLERFYSVFDTIENRVGFATMPHTFDQSN